jgi:hypothetical protein
MNPRHAAVLIFIACCFSTPVFAQRKIPPYGLWNDKVLAEIKDRGTLSHIASGSRFAVHGLHMDVREP